jgi:hypothetical protein
MTTFKEVQDRLGRAVSKGVVYRHLIEHLESSFLPLGGASPKNVLLTDTKLPVPEAILTEVISELHYGLKQVTDERDSILGAEVVQPQAVAVPQGEVKT